MGLDHFTHNTNQQTFTQTLANRTWNKIIAHELKIAEKNGVSKVSLISISFISLKPNKFSGAKTNTKQKKK